MREISQEKIKHGLNKVAKSGTEWPPSAPEFRSICLDEDIVEEEVHHEHRRIEEADKVYRANQKKLNVGTREDRLKIANEHIKKAREGLGK